MSPQLAVRPATDEDMQRVWEWANDPDARTSSFSGKPIAWDDHLAWWATWLSDPHFRLFIGEVDGRPIGYVRFQGSADTAEISVALDRDHRGRGFAAELIRQASVADGRSHVAYVLVGNVASERAFMAAGYQHCEEVEVRGRRSHRFERPSDV